MLQPAVHRAILIVDVEKFGDPARTNIHQLAIRDTVYKVLQQSFARARIGWADCVTEDRGDGVLVLVPPTVPKSLLVAALPVHLAKILARHNAACPAQCADPPACRAARRGGSPGCARVHWRLNQPGFPPDRSVGFKNSPASFIRGGCARSIRLVLRRSGTAPPGCRAFMLPQGTRSDEGNQDDSLGPRSGARRTARLA